MDAPNPERVGFSQADKFQMAYCSKQPTTKRI
jgi:hypothetical protein